MERQTHAAVGLLGRMLAGISSSATPFDDDEPDLSASAIDEVAPGVVVAKLHLPTGDTYEVRVAWLSDESP